MACCGGNSSTPLAQYARSLRTQLDDGEKLPMLFPMYTVPFGTFLEMTMIEPHEELKARGVLVEFQMNMGNAAFVSHQWVASSHPDPECRQMKVLQDALKNMMGKLKSIPSDVISEAQNPNLKPKIQRPRFWPNRFSFGMIISRAHREPLVKLQLIMPSTAYRHMWTSARSFLPLYPSWRTRVEPI